MSNTVDTLGPLFPGLIRVNEMKAWFKENHPGVEFIELEWLVYDQGREIGFVGYLEDRRVEKRVGRYLFLYGENPRISWNQWMIETERRYVGIITRHEILEAEEITREGSDVRLAGSVLKEPFQEDGQTPAHRTYCPNPRHLLFEVEGRVKAVPLDCSKKDCDHCGALIRSRYARHFLKVAPDDGHRVFVSDGQWASFRRGLNRREAEYICFPVEGGREVFTVFEAKGSVPCQLDEWLFDVLDRMSTCKGRKVSSSTAWSGWSKLDLYPEEDKDDKPVMTPLKGDVDKVIEHLIATWRSKRIPEWNQSQTPQPETVRKLLVRHGVPIEAIYGTPEWYTEIRGLGLQAKHEPPSIRWPGRHTDIEQCLRFYEKGRD